MRVLFYFAPEKYTFSLLGVQAFTDIIVWRPLLSSVGCNPISGHGRHGALCRRSWKTGLFCCPIVRTRNDITSRKYDVWKYCVVDLVGRTDFFHMPVGEKNVNIWKFCSLNLFIYFRIGNDCHCSVLLVVHAIRTRNDVFGGWKVREPLLSERGLSAMQSFSVNRTKTLVTYQRLTDLTKHVLVFTRASCYGSIVQIPAVICAEFSGIASLAPLYHRNRWHLFLF
jgi:hypothetical protein